MDRMDGSDTSRSGLWSCSRVTYSRETSQLLQMMMKESRLSSFQQRQINNQLKNGGSLPLVCNPSSSAPPAQPQLSLRLSKDSTLTARPQRRSAEKCRAGDSYTPEKFRPTATRDLEKEKQRLQNLLSTGQQEAPLSHSHTQSSQTGEVRQTDRFQEVLEEIEERRQFLEEMEAIGRGNQYFTIINTEISQKIRELELIDRTRSRELRRLVLKEREEDTPEEEEEQK